MNQSSQKTNETPNTSSVERLPFEAELQQNHIAQQLLQINSNLDFQLRELKVRMLLAHSGNEIFEMNRPRWRQQFIELAGLMEVKA